MAGPIGHGVSKALREARDKGADGGRRGGPPPWLLALVAAVLIAGIVWAAMTL
jgi:hypothetical protein